MTVVAILGRGIVVLLLAVVTLLTAVRLLALDRGFPLATVMTVFPYVVVIAGSLAIVGFPAGWRIEASLAAVVALTGVAMLVPRLVAGPRPSTAPDGPTFTVAVANLRFGMGDAATVVAAVERHDVDALVVLELTQDAIDRLADAGLDRLLPHATLTPSRRTSGGGIYSRHPLEPLPPSTQRRFGGGTPRATIALGSREVELDAVHPLPPVNASWTEAWREALLGLASAGTAEEGTPLRILAGDFNATEDHTIFREVLARGWIDAASAVGAGLRPTFNALGYREPVPPVTLDHVLVDARTEVLRVAVEPLPRSDHRIVVASLRLPAR